MAEPKFDANGWCSDMSLAPTKGYTEILVRQVNEETGDCVHDSYYAYCIPDIIEEDDGWVNTHWKLIKPPEDGTEIKVMPSDENLPSLHDLRGIAPNATGDISSEDFIRGLRDEWENKAIIRIEKVKNKPTKDKT